MSNQVILMRGFAFSQEELALNKAGQLSPRQMDQVKARLKYQGPAHRISLAIFGVMALGFTALPFVITGPGTQEAKPVLIGFAIFVWIALITIAVYQRRSLRDLMQNRVSTIEGPVRLRQKTVRTHHTAIGTAFVMKVGHAKYQLEAPEQYDALQDGASYRFHVVRNMRVPLVLAVEAL